MGCLYIFYINPLSFTSFGNISFHSVGCHFVLLMVSFAMQKLLSLIRSLSLSFFFFFLLLPLCLRRLIQENIAMIYVKLKDFL